MLNIFQHEIDVIALRKRGVKRNNKVFKAASSSRGTHRGRDEGRARSAGTLSLRGTHYYGWMPNKYK